MLEAEKFYARLQNRNSDDSEFDEVYHTKKKVDLKKWHTCITSKKTKCQGSGKPSEGMSKDISRPCFLSKDEISKANDG